MLSRLQSAAPTRHDDSNVAALEMYWTRLASVTELQLTCWDSFPAGLADMTGQHKITRM